MLFNRMNLIPVAGSGISAGKDRRPLSPAASSRGYDLSQFGAA